jgi:hypothetical protein
LGSALRTTEAKGRSRPLLDARHHEVLARRRCVIAESERFWERAIERLEEGSVVPILGPDLLEVVHEGRKSLFYPLVATRLAGFLGVAGGDLPRGRELEEVARRYLSSSDDVQEIYRCLRVVFHELDALATPEPLLKLARIPELDLFVTTTFDVWTERAVDLERFSGQRQTLAFAYAPNDKQDLPPEFERLNRPAVFHLFGRISGTPHSFAVTREDTLAFMQSLESRAEDSPGFFFDKLRRSDLLILGSDAAEWLARLCTRDTRAEQHGGPGAGSQGALFVCRFSGRTELLSGPAPLYVVDELYRRSSDLRQEREPPPASLLPLVSQPALQSGAVLLSSVEADRKEALALRDELDRAGVDVLLDWDDAPLPEKWERKLKGFLSECSVFVPLVSRRSVEAERRFFRPEWIEAIGHAARTVPSGRFVVPVTLDDVSPASRALPEAFGEISWEKSTSELVRNVVELQRSYRSARFV